jgi:flagellar hook protein FlgE
MSFTRQDEVRPDDNYYWVTQNSDGSYTGTPKALEDRAEVDQDGNPMYVQVYDSATQTMVNSTERLITKGLKSNHIASVKHNTNMTLAQTDWYVIRKAERSVDIPADVATYRAAVVAWATATEASITAVTTVEELKLINLGVSI